MSQVRLSVYKNNIEVFYVEFDAKGSDKMNWVDRNRILDSSASDIKTAASNIFTIKG